MFQNKNWGKVLISQGAMVGVTLGVSFLCQYSSTEDKAAALAAAAAFIGITASTACFALIITVYDPPFLAVAIALVAAFVAALAAAAAFVATLVTGILVIIAFVLLLPVALLVALLVAPAVAAVAEEYKLPKLWVTVSYIAEAVAIFLPIFFTVN